MKIVSLFSGIGSAEFALQQLKVDYTTIFACEKDKNARENYIKNHINKCCVFYNDIKDISCAYHDIDLLIGGSPCQSFSNLGNNKGFDDDRGNLFFEYIRILEAVQPTYFIFENSSGANKFKHKNTILETFNNLVGNYQIQNLTLCPTDIGIPVKRNRFYVVGSKKHIKGNLITVDDIGYQKLNKTVFDFVDFNKKVDDWYYLGANVPPYVFENTSTFNKGWKLDKPVATCFLAQDFNKNRRALIGNYYNTPHGIRTLTADERLQLMGFKGFENVCSTQQLIKQIGNAMSVDVMKIIIKGLIKNGI